MATDPPLFSAERSVATQWEAPNRITEIVNNRRRITADTALRLRRARHDLIDRAYGDYSYLSKAEEGKRSKIIMHLARTIGLDAKVPDEFQELFRPLHGPAKSAAILSDFAAQLSALERYERRALSRRKFAIRAFDAVRPAKVGERQRAGPRRLGSNFKRGSK